MNQKYYCAGNFPKNFALLMTKVCQIMQQGVKRNLFEAITQPPNKKQKIEPVVAVEMVVLQNVGKSVSKSQLENYFLNTYSLTSKDICFDYIQNDIKLTTGKKFHKTTSFFFL